MLYEVITLILQFENPDVEVWQIGAEGGFLPAPVRLNDHPYPGTSGGATVLMALAERADVIVDFTNVPVGTEVLLLNLGPDEPFGGGTAGVDFVPADPDSTGQVMQFVITSYSIHYTKLYETLHGIAGITYQVDQGLFKQAPVRTDHQIFLSTFCDQTNVFSLQFR